MKMTLKILSWMALAAIVSLSVVYFSDSISLERVQVAMLICAAVWFGTAPFWMEHKVQ